ncbi:hypothetical protein E2C01_093358 [Portunus trituberculatus]|uniref:Uncharacterized protein n=1 Tax=Portunus trituberculatus TaxID=210409 RepID=A0A5B7JTB4_PORTR|nr:hypothetical protein [Portunus trituberculatus]
MGRRGRRREDRERRSDKGRNREMERFKVMRARENKAYTVLMKAGTAAGNLR